MLHRRMSKAPSGAGMAVGDPLAGPGPAGDAPRPLGAARTRYRTCTLPGATEMRSTRAQSCCGGCRWAAPKAAAAAMATAATLGAWAVWPRPPASSTTLVVEPCAHNGPQRGVSSA